MNEAIAEQPQSRGFYSRHRKAIGFLVLSLIACGVLSYQFLLHPQPTTPKSTSQTTPVVVGWGGIRMDEVSTTSSGNPPSRAFPGQTASDMERSEEHTSELQSPDH